MLHHFHLIHIPAPLLLSPHILIVWSTSTTMLFKHWDYHYYCYCRQSSRVLITYFFVFCILRFVLEASLVR